MTHRHWAGMALTLVLLITTVAFSAQIDTSAQEPPAPNTDPNVVITFPPPVYVLRGDVEIRGTVNLPNLANYFLEFRPLDPETLQPVNEDDPFLPATLPQTGTVLDDVLATWNTTTVEDGLYQLRLTANVSRQGATVFVVSPLRVENELPPFLEVEVTPTSAVVIEPVATATPGIIITRPTLASTPTSISDDPTVTANLDANVRSGDSTIYPVVGSLPSGFSAAVVGISNTGSGWYYVELSNGRRGFISPTVVTTSGNLAGLPRIAPPPPPATATPTPLPTTGDVVPNGLVPSPAEPRCNEAFEAHVNITNAGSTSFGSGGSVQVRAQHVSSGSVTASSVGTFPALTPGQNFVVVVPLLVNQFGGDDYRLLAQADIFNNIIEENEGNNSFTSTTFRLRRAACP